MINLCIENGFHSFEWLHQSRTGAHVWVEVSLTCLNVESPRKIHVLWHNIETQKGAQHKVNVFDSFVIFSKTDTQGIITEVNENFCAISGYSKEELVGSTHSIVSHPDTPKRVFKELWKTITSHGTWEGKIKNRKKDGSLYCVKAKIFPEYNHFGEIIGYESVREDMTDIYEANIEIVQEKERAQKAERAQADFLATMSHEIRTPMNSIIGFSNLLYETDLDLEQEKYSSLIRHSTKMLLNIVNDILDYSKIDNQKLILNPIPTNLYVELHSLYAQFKITTDEKDIDFYLEVDPRVGEIVEIDILRLIQILTNLLSNAIKFTPKFGKIKLTVGYIEGSRASQQLYFELVDSGIGISSEEIKNIFKVFEHANKSINTEFGGTGLGLSISNSLVKLTGS